MAQVLDSPIGDRARAALARHAWSEAFELLAAADSEGNLTPDELELLGQASWWTGRLPAAIEARERAYAGYLKGGDTIAAARTAGFLGRDNVLRRNHSVATAWLNRADRLVAGLPENVGAGWLAATRAFQASASGRLDEALALVDRAAEIAERFGDRDLDVLARSTKGIILVYQGRVEEGLALADEAAIAAVAGEVDPMTAGAVSCTTISACTAIGDWVRAVQWTEAQDRWCQREAISGFPGMCRLYRAETKRLRGAWLEAESEARRAAEELAGFIPAAIGAALYEIGAIRLQRGDLPGAEDALRRAHAYGRVPEPALSLVRLAQGRTDDAAASIRRALAEPEPLYGWGPPPGTAIHRLSLLPAQVEIALAAGDIATARAAADEVAGLAERFPSTASTAVAACLDGLVLIAEGSAANAVAPIRRSIQLWREVEAPWEVARARMALGQAYAAIGDDDAATLEFESARAEFEALGADLDRRRADEALASLAGGARSATAATSTQRTTKTFVFTDIVDSTRLAELLGEEAWERLIAWHDQMLRSLIAEHGGEEVKRTGDGFFLAFESPAAAIDAAIAIQRRLAEHSRSEGFSPAVRIGIHRGRATRSGSDYIGLGVNAAARIGSLAGSGEILASVPTLDAARRPVADASRRTVALKGIAAPVEVASIAW